MIETEASSLARVDGGEKIKCTHLKDLTQADIDISNKHLKP